MRGQNYDLNDLVEMLGVSERTILRMVKNHELPGFRVRSEWRFPKALIDQRYARAMETGKF